MLPSPRISLPSRSRPSRSSGASSCISRILVDRLEVCVNRLLAPTQTQGRRRVQKKRLGMDQLVSLAQLTTVHGRVWSTVGFISKLAGVSAYLLAVIRVAP